MDDTSSQASSTVNTLEANGNSTSVAAARSQPTSSAARSAQAQSNPSIEKPPATIQLQLYRLAENSITLIWNDVTGISHYKISRNGKFIAKVDYPSYMFVDQGLTPNTDYNYTISTFDVTGNESGPSQTFTMRTLAANGTPSSTPNLSAQPDSSMSSITTTSAASANLSSNPSSISSKSSSSYSLSSTSSKSSSSHSPSSTSSISSSSHSPSSTSSISSSSHSLSSTSSISSSSHSLSSTSSISSSMSSSAASSMSSVSSAGQQAVTISWSHPSQRENGDFLELEEIGGYEIRYRKPTDTLYTSITLDGNHMTEYTFAGEAQDLEFEIAVFDNRGIYSRFVKITQ